jgi:Serpin (serine protease inhibitor)
MTASRFNGPEVIVMPVRGMDQERQERVRPTARLMPWRAIYQRFALNNFRSHVDVNGTSQVRLKPAFLDEVRAMGADLAPVDFGGLSACAAMNEWVCARTSGEIDRLLDPGDIAAGTVLLILTVFYFKGRWAQKFDPAQTREELFKLADGTDQRPPTMHRVGTFSYGRVGSCGVVELPFASGRVGMRVLLPAKGSSGEDEMMEALLQRPQFPEQVGEVVIHAAPAH